MAVIPKPEAAASDAVTLLAQDSGDVTLQLGTDRTILSEPRAVDASPGPELSADAMFTERYALGMQLGEGGMGEVRACMDAHIGREVAIKVIRAGHGSRSDMAMRFLREARVQGQLEHPSIVPVYDLGRDPRGSAYFTMKRVRGLTLEDILAGAQEGDEKIVGEFTLRKLLTAFGNVCLTVHFAHARGVLHRDLKPANVMLGDFGEVYVLDWGLAKLVGSDDSLPSARGAPVVAVSENEGNTAYGAIMGTPGYMAPEQIQGENELMGPQADIYALGAILFEILTRRALNVGRTAQDVLMATLKGSEARPSLRAPERLVPPELEAICVRATALAPLDRYSSAREMHDAIEGYLDGDRDLGRRRTLAGKHADIAEVAAERALQGGDSASSDRSLALQEVGHAMAVDPNNERAQRILLRLLTEPPRDLPPEARAEFFAGARESQRVAMRTAALAYMSWVLYLPLGWWMGARSWTFPLLTELLWLVAAAACFYVYKRPNPDGSTTPVVIVTSSLAVAFTAPLFGPLMLLPAIAGVNTLALVLTVVHKRGRQLAILSGNLAILLPLLLQVLGVFPSSYVFANGTMTIMPMALEFPRVPTLVFLVVGSMALITTASVYVARVKDALTAAQRRLVLQSWHLRQLVPKDAHSAMPNPPAPPAKNCVL